MSNAFVYLLVRWHGGGYGYSHGSLGRSFAHGVARAAGWRLVYSLGPALFGGLVVLLVASFAYRWLRSRRSY